MAVWRITGDHAEPVEGIVLTRVHSADRCEGRPCVIHAPSEHRMASWPLHWRDDRSLFERTCPHGVGHPDPDHMAWLRSILVDQEDAVAEGIHGCDGCCAADSPHDASEPPPSATDPQKTSEGADGAVASQQSPSERLRLAADRLEQTAAETSPIPWTMAGGRAMLVPWVALAEPDLAKPLAAWLRDEADRLDEHADALAAYRPDPVVDFGDDQRPPWTAEEIAINVAHHWRHELAVADVILGGGA